MPRGREKHRSQHGADEGTVGVIQGGAVEENDVPAVHDGARIKTMLLPEDAGKAAVAEPAHQSVLAALHQFEETRRLTLRQLVQVFQLAADDTVVKVRK